MDADHLACHIEERPSRVPADEDASRPQVIWRHFENAAFAQRWRAALLKAARMAKRETPIAFLKTGRAAHFQMLEFVFLRRDLNHAAVDGAVGAKGLALQFTAVVKNDLAR